MSYLLAVSFQLSIKGIDCYPPEDCDGVEELMEWACEFYNTLECRVEGADDEEDGFIGVEYCKDAIDRWDVYNAQSYSDGTLKDAGSTVGHLTPEYAKWAHVVTLKLFPLLEEAVIFKRTTVKTSSPFAYTGPGFDDAEYEQDVYAPTPESALHAVAAAAVSTGGGGDGGGAAAAASASGSTAASSSSSSRKRRVKDAGGGGGGGAAGVARTLAAGSWQAKAGTGAGATASPPVWVRGTPFATSAEVDGYLGMQPTLADVENVLAEAGLGEPIKIRGQMHKCPQCSKVATKKSLCLRHMITHLDMIDYPYACPCGTRTAELPNVRIHYRAAHLKEQLKCPKCTLWASDKSNLNRHMKSHH